MLRLLRFLVASCLLVWLGVVITLTFYVAPSLFGNVSGEVPNTGVAGEIIAPMLHRMELTAWIALPIAILLHILIYRLVPKRVVIVSACLLSICLSASIYSGLPLTHQIHGIRAELKEKYGRVDLAPREDEARRRFGMLHGVAMSLVMVELALGAGCFFCVTQLFEKKGY